MLSSEDAFLYVIARTEKSGSNGQHQADARRQIKKRIGDLSPSIELWPEKKIGRKRCLAVARPANNRCGSHEGERTGKANRSIRAKKLSVVRWSNVDIVPASGPKKIIGA